MNNRLEAILGQGQSVWYDNIRRALLDSGDLQELIEQGIRGVTSNPSIFEKAIAGSSDYDDEMRQLAANGLGVEAIFEQLALTDISRAAELLSELYETSAGEDGYVSLEVNPRLAEDTEGTVKEALRLVGALDQPNVMIKVPATEAGIPAIQQLIARGVNVNVTLIFAVERYQQVMEAYAEGLQAWIASGGAASEVASVASFFISRLDVAVDARLPDLGLEELKGKTAIANAKIAYQLFQDFIRGDRWQQLDKQGARIQRPLWASTSTKDPSYPTTMYADALIGPHTVNTLPPATLREVMDHGATDSNLTQGVQSAQAQLDRLAEAGIELNEITGQLEADGVESFAEAYQRLLTSMRQKLAQLKDQQKPLEIELGPYQERYLQSLTEVSQSEVIQRIWNKDHTVWQPDPEEISNRLGWLTIPARMKGVTAELGNVATHLYQKGFRKAVLLGMGGSSLAPEVFRETFGVADERLELQVLDSTDPQAILNLDQSLDLSETLFIVATKSGSTVETLSFFKYFYNRVAATVDTGTAGEHFVAITDPGSRLVELAKRYKFRRTFINDPNIGGRYSALSYFGLVPAALLGVDLDELIERALTAGCAYEACVPCRENPAAELGTAIAELAKTGRDKLTFVISEEINHFGDWVEQLLAESTGKDGQGILPVVGEPLADSADYRQDRVFVHLRMAGDSSQDQRLVTLKSAGHPVIQINLTDRYDLGGQIFLWEMATAVAGERLGIHPFNQPNVESAKIRARQMVEAYQQEGKLPSEKPGWRDGQLSLFWGSPEGEAGPELHSLSDGIEALLAAAKAGSYFSLHAYLTPTEQMENELRQLQGLLLAKTSRAVTLGFGPRFLHSTGQLHKGDAGHGLFLQLTADPAVELAIPDEAGSKTSGLDFGVLIRAQARGDRQALIEAGRTVLRVDFGSEPSHGLEALRVAVQSLGD